MIDRNDRPHNNGSNCAVMTEGLDAYMYENRGRYLARRQETTAVPEREIPAEIRCVDPSFRPVEPVPASRLTAIVVQNDLTLSTLSEERGPLGGNVHSSGCFDIFGIFGKLFHSCNGSSNPPPKSQRRDKDHSLPSGDTMNSRTGYSSTDSLGYHDDCCSPICSDENSSMINHPSTITYQYQRSERNTYGERWDDAFRQPLAPSLPYPTSSTKDAEYPSVAECSTPRRKGAAAAPIKATKSARSAFTKTTCRVPNTVVESTPKTQKPQKKSTSGTFPTTSPSPMSALSRPSTSATSHKSSQSRRHRSQSIPPPHHMSKRPSQTQANQQLTRTPTVRLAKLGKKKVTIPRGTLHNFELTDDYTSSKSGPIVSWAPSDVSAYGISTGDHIIKVNGKDTRKMSALDVTRMLHTKKNKERTICLTFDVGVGAGDDGVLHEC